MRISLSKVVGRISVQSLFSPINWPDFGPIFFYLDFNIELVGEFLRCVGRIHDKCDAISLASALARASAIRLANMLLVVKDTMSGVLT